LGCSFTESVVENTKIKTPLQGKFIELSSDIFFDTLWGKNGRCFRVLLVDIWAFLFKGQINPRAKALGPNQNKNAHIPLVNLSKQNVS
jgi:hypothetical protein